jgi:hypothetical protein
MIVLRRLDPPTVRLAIVDESDRVLLGRHVRPLRPAWWALPGTPRATGPPANRAQAELCRLGWPDASPGDIAWQRTVTVWTGTELVNHNEDVFVVRAGPPLDLAPLRWWPLAELASLPDPVYPRNLADLIRWHIARPARAEPLIVVGT